MLEGPGFNRARDPLESQVVQFLALLGLCSLRHTFRLTQAVIKTQPHLHVQSMNTITKIIKRK